MCSQYATLAKLASVSAEDFQAAAAGLPPIDSLDMSGMLLGRNTTSPRTEIALSYAPEHTPGSGAGSTALISGRYKLILYEGGLLDGFFPGPTTPNGSNWHQEVNCSGGCLFDLESDPVEHKNLAAEQPAVLAALKARLQEIGATVYQSTGNPKKQDAAAVAAAAQRGGFWGPWIAEKRCTLLKGSDCKGKQVGRAMTSSEDRCCALCHSNARCDSFTWVNKWTVSENRPAGESNGECFLKSGGCATATDCPCCVGGGL